MMRTAEENRIRKIRRTLEKYGYHLRKRGERFHIFNQYREVARPKSLKETEEYVEELADLTKR